MMERKQYRRLSEGRKASRPRPSLTSGIIGGALIAVCALWLGWLYLHQSGGAHLPALPGIMFVPPVSSNVQIAPLTAEGITLGHTSQVPALSQQQAFLIASQLEPGTAARSKSSSANYVLLNYPNQGTPATHVNLNSVPAWMVVYQKVPVTPADASVDSGPAFHTTYDLYLFLDANSGKELLAVQV